MPKVCSYVCGVKASLWTNPREELVKHKLVKKFMLAVIKSHDGMTAALCAMLTWGKVDAESQWGQCETSSTLSCPCYYLMAVA